MQIRAISSLSDAAAARWVGVLSVVAIAVSVGVLLIARHSAERSAKTAELSFDSSMAARDDAAVAHATEPALTLAQSMLTETTVLDLLRQAGAYPSDAAVGIGEFRSHLELQQPSGNRLRIIYHDSNPLTARKVANAVAAAIVDWHPAVAYPPAAAQPLTATRPVRSVPARASSRTRVDSLHTAYITLANLERQLAAANEKIEILSRTSASRTQTANAPALPSDQADQRRTLQTKLAADHQKLDELRLRYTDEYPDVENMKDEISDLQQELAALPPETTRPSRGSVVPGTAEIADLRQHRASLTDQIATQKDAIAYIHLHPDSHSSSRPQEAASVAPTVPAEASPEPAMIGTAAWENPFKIARLAALTGGSLVWPAILASSLCILFAVPAILIFVPWHRHMHSLHPADIALDDSPFAYDSHASIPEMLAPSAPIVEEPDEHPTQEPALQATQEVDATKEFSAISLVEPEQQSIDLQKTSPEIVDAELIEASVSESHETSPADAVSETELTPHEGSTAEATDHEPFMPASLPLATLDINPGSKLHSEFAEMLMQAEMEQKDFRNMSAESGEVDSEWSARILKGLSQTSTVQMLELQRRGEN
jgi:uncharacterized membrane protein